MTLLWPSPSTSELIFLTRLEQEYNRVCQFINQPKPQQNIHFKSNKTLVASFARYASRSCAEETTLKNRTGAQRPQLNFIFIKLYLMNSVFICS